MNRPVSIDSLTVPGGGRIGITSCPGRWRLFGSIGAERGGIQHDLDRIAAWGARLLISLVEDDELAFLGIDDLGRLVGRADMSWLHLPIPDFRAPGEEFERGWERHGPEVHDRLARGEDVAIHCLAGLGRSGTVAARLLIELGDDPEEAVHRVRLARPGAIQSAEQERYLLGFRASRPAGVRA